MVEDVDHNSADNNDPTPATFRVIMAAECGHFASVERQIGQKTFLVFGTRVIVVSLTIKRSKQQRLLKQNRKRIFPTFRLLWSL